MSDTKQPKEAEDGPSDDDPDHHQEDTNEDTSNLSLNSASVSMRRSSSSEILVERSARDILCGRGVQVLHHAGNLHLHFAADEFREEYLGSKRDRKREIIETIVKRLKSTGSRFLKTSQTDKTKWVEADDSFSYQKVSHVLRGQNTGKAVKKIKKQEIEIAKERKEQVIQAAATNQLSQGSNIAMMPNQRLHPDLSLVSQAPLGPNTTSVATNALLQNHPLLNLRGLASLREANLGIRMLQQQSLHEWPTRINHQNLLQSHLLTAASTAAPQAPLTSLLLQSNNSIFLPHRITNRHIQERQRLLTMQQHHQQSLNPSAVLQRLMQSNNATSGFLQEQLQSQQSFQAANNNSSITTIQGGTNNDDNDELVDSKMDSRRQDGLDQE